MSDTLKYFTSVFLYGTIGYFLSFVNATSDFVVMCRGLLGALFILFVYCLKHQKIDAGAIKRNLKSLVVSGVSLGLNHAFLFAGYRYAVSMASLGNYVAPVAIVVISALVYKQKLGIKQMVCVALSFIGIVFISGVLSGGNRDIRALVLGLLGAIFFTILVLENRKLKDINPLDRTIVQLFLSGFTVSIYVLFNGNIPSAIDYRSILIILMLGFLHTGVAYILYFGSIATLEATKIAVIGYVEPVLAVLSGALLLKEPMNFYSVIGAILIIASALALELFASKAD